jgi:uncharacterized MAPEG superfamily protein
MVWSAHAAHPLLTILIPLMVAVCVTLFSKAPMAFAQTRTKRGYDNASPREQQERLEGWGARARAAHHNGWEAFQILGIGAACVLATGHDGVIAAALGWVWIGARVFYTAAYVKGLGVVRTTFWCLALGCSFGLYVLALVGSPVGVP